MTAVHWNSYIWWEMNELKSLQASFTALCSLKTVFLINWQILITYNDTNICEKSRQPVSRKAINPYEVSRKFPLVTLFDFESS